MSKDINRRDFLKISGTAAFVSATCMPGTLGALGNIALEGSEKQIGSICEMCSSFCPIEGRVVNGKNVFIQGNRHSIPTGSTVCARGGSGHSQLYDEQRLVTPLIRLGKRGENKWREASWDEALDLVAQKFGDIKEKYGAKAITFSSKAGPAHTHMNTFANALGSPNTYSHLTSCPMGYVVAFNTTIGTLLKCDYAGAKYILNFGHNLFEGLDIALTRPLSQAAAAEKTKFVVLDPRFSVIAAKADEWLPVKAGTDLAFILSLIHIWLRDGKYDQKFVEEYTIGLEELKKSVLDATPQWQETITGIKASVAERIANEIYEAAPHCIIDWGHKTTMSKTEYQARRAMIIANILMGNIEKKGGTYFPKSAELINTLAGEEIVPTLDNPDASMQYPDIPRIDGAGESGENKFIPKTHGSLTDIPKTILSKKPYETKAWFITRSNPLITIADPATMKKAMAALDFLVVNDIYMSESALMADVVLPEATYLERDEGIMEISSKYPVYISRNKIVEPINKNKCHIEIFRTLANKMGIDAKYTWKSASEYRTAQAKGNFELLKELQKGGYVTFDVPELFARESHYVERFIKKYPLSQKNLNREGYFDQLLRNLNTPSGKIELFSAQVEEEFPGLGSPGIADMDLYNGYEYILSSGKTAIHTNGHTQNVPFLNMLMNDNPVWIHPQSAKKENLKDGDKIYLVNDTGKEKATVMITEGIRPDTLFVYMGFGRESEDLKRTNGVGTNQSKLLPLDKNQVCSTMITNVGVKIVKA